MDESRLDYLEGRVEEQSRNWERLFADVGGVHQRIDALSTRIDASINTMNSRYDALDQKLDRKIDGLRVELATQFHWTIGILAALFTGLLAAILRR